MTAKEMKEQAILRSNPYDEDVDRIFCFNEKQLNIFIKQLCKEQREKDKSRLLKSQALVIIDCNLSYVALINKYFNNAPEP